VARPLSVDDLLDIRTLASQNAVALSPDGRWVAYAVQRDRDWRQRHLPRGGVALTAQGARLLVTDLDTGRTVSPTDPDWTSWAPAWSPDGRTLAFYAATSDAGPVRLWIWDAVSGQARQCVHAPIQPWHLAAARPRWMADGRRVCVTTLPDGDGRGPEQTAPASEAPPRVFESPEPAADRRPPSEGRESWADIGLVDVGSGDVRTVTSGLPVRHAFPSPRGDDLLWVDHPSVPDRAQNEARSALHLLRADGTDVVLAHFTEPPTGHHGPRWSPDGRRVALVDDGVVLVWSAADSRDGPLRLRPPGDRRAEEGFALWTADGEALLVWGERAIWRLALADRGAAAQPLHVPGWRIVSLIHRTDSGVLPEGDPVVLARKPMDGGAGWKLFRLPLDGSAAEPLTEGEGDCEGQPFQAVYSFNADASRDGTRFVFAAGDVRTPRQLWLATDGARQCRPVADLNPHLGEVALGERRRFAFRTSEGVQAGATILLPPDWQEGRPCPTVVAFYPDAYPSKDPNGFSAYAVPEVVHGQLLASRGFAVLMPDVPYDQSGPGDPAAAGTAAVLPAVNEAVRLGYCDPERLAMSGHSYGGYGVLALLTQTGRFRAAVASAAPADMASMYGKTLAGDHIGGEAWCESEQGGMGAPPWERPLRYVANSPVFLADRIRTPLLLICGDADRGVPWSQSGEMFVALRRLGRRCTLAVYPGEEHNPDRYSEGHRMDVLRRVVSWLEEHLTRGLSPEQ